MKKRKAAALELPTAAQRPDTEKRKAAAATPPTAAQRPDMEKKNAAAAMLPTAAQIRAELHREQHNRQYRQILRNTVCAMLIAAAAAVLVTVWFLPVLQINGSSMAPTLQDGDVVVSAKRTEPKPGDLVCFKLEDQLLIKRYIAGPGQRVDMDADGNVYVDDELLNEPYLTEKVLGECDIDLPCQVPEGQFFCLGDQRSTSLDSRSSTVGCVADGQIVGKIIFRIWPLADFGVVK